ncbi:GumC family protein [Endozoicomonas arenosclerae]|uniref:GumC family protein n=1 Tax=Endozoicomonas arenosclerae TaxID=1633495 RepID=UPI000782387E|nr:polysaccharide biosynthesis tyrosine autokinase [Endozoicomonas arenosclerae]
MNQPVQYSTVVKSRDTEVISISELFSVLKIYRWLIPAFTLLVTLAAVFYVQSLKPQYRATATLMIEDRDKSIISIKDVYGIAGSDTYLNTQYEILRSRAVMERALRDLIRQGKMSLDNSEQGFNMLLDEFAKQVSVSPVRKTQIVYIAYQSEDPELAASAANAIAHAYKEAWLDSRLAVTTHAKGWMQVRLKDLTAELEEAEQALQSYRDREGLIDLGGDLVLSRSELTALTQSLAAIRGQLAKVESVYLQIRNTGKDNFEDLGSLPVVLQSGLIQRLKEDKSVLEREVEELSRRYGPKHPKMKSALSKLESINQNVQKQIRKIVQGAEREYEVALASEKAVQANVGKARAQVQEINRKQFRLNELERQVQTKRDLYDVFFTRIGETQATSDLNTSNARIIDEAIVPLHPYSPKKKLIVMAAAVIALVLSLVLVVIREMLDNTIRISRDVEEKLQQRLLAVIPEKKQPKRKGKGLLRFSPESPDTFSESIRTIRSSIQLNRSSPDQKVFAVTSTVASEGKTSIALNTALAFAELGRTLLVEANLRKPAIQQHLDDEVFTGGLVDILQSQAQVESCITQHGKLAVLSSGLETAAAQELLASERFSNLLGLLKEQYDYVFIDCPPVEKVSDALVVARVCDGVLYVVGAGKANVERISSETGRIIQSGASIAGVILNKADPSRTLYKS